MFLGTAPPPPAAFNTATLRNGIGAARPHLLWYVRHPTTDTGNFYFLFNHVQHIRVMGVNPTVRGEFFYLPVATINEKRSGCCMEVNPCKFEGGGGFRRK